jgi:tetratricopeptide (TPR) repeat protein
LIISRGRPFFGILRVYYRWTTVMISFWRFLRDKRNQQVLGWLGGGLVVLATGVWVAFVYFFPPAKAPEAKPPLNVQAVCGGVAIGGNATGVNITGAATTCVSSSNINIGIPPEQFAALVRQGTDFSETQKKLIAKLEGELDLNQRQIHAALGILGESNVAPERLAAKLVEVAERFKVVLQAPAPTQSGDNPNIAALKADAQKAIAAGELAKADALLADVETEQRDRFALNAAETSARRGEIALTRLRYAEAATHFAKAAAVFPPGTINENKRIDYLNREASALYEQGYELGDNGALLSAIERRKRLVELMPRERVPLDWARTQRNLGVALSSLGERESGVAKLQEAVTAYREALKEHTREPLPLDWAMTQNNLAVTLTRLGEREGATAKLEEAVAAFREAQKELTRERVPLDWATIQNNVGVVLFKLGGLEGGTAKFEEAVAAFREALKERTRERVPLDWATTQNNLGNALAQLGLRENGKLEEAIAAYREALKEYTRERVPLDWAMTQNNLAATLFFLGERETGTAMLEESVVAFREALKERTPERAPLDWAISLGAQGMALTLIAERRGDAGMAESALGQINTAFETMRDGGIPHTAAYLEQQLLKARAIVARLRGQ